MFVGINYMKGCSGPGFQETGYFRISTGIFRFSWIFAPNVEISEIPVFCDYLKSRKMSKSRKYLFFPAFFKIKMSKFGNTWFLEILDQNTPSSIYACDVGFCVHSCTPPTLQVLFTVSTTVCLTGSGQSRSTEI